MTLFAEGTKASASMDDVVLTLSLSGGSKAVGPPATVKMTAVDVTLDICDPRESDSTEPQALAQPPQDAPASASKPRDKRFGGRALPEQNATRTSERAMLLVRKIEPGQFDGKLVLKTIGNVRAFGREVPSADPADDPPFPARFVFEASDVSLFDKKLFAEGVSLSSKLRDAGFSIGIEGLQEDADQVAITVVNAEIVSTVAPGDPSIIALVPESPERKTRSGFFPAPIIIGVNFFVALQPHIDLPAAAEPPEPMTFQWSTTAAAKLTLTDTTEEEVQLRAAHISEAIDDVEIGLLVTDTRLGKFRARHKMTLVDFRIQSAIRGEIPTAADDINFVRNPAVLPILTGAAAADVAQAPKVEITNADAHEALKFADDDPRIAWRITGGQAAQAGLAVYAGRADFLPGDAARRGLKIQVVGVQTPEAGDVLIEAWSGGFPYAMFRSNVQPMRAIKYRVNRILVPAVPATATRPARDAHGPTRSHAESKQHVRVINIYLRQLGIEIIPDTSSDMAQPTPGNSQVGLEALDRRVVATTQDSAGHFDVTVTDLSMTFRAADRPGAQNAIRVNSRNEIISFAYVESLAAGNSVLAVAELCPPNHTPARTFTDNGVPSTSLTPNTGIPGSEPVGTFRLRVLPPIGVLPKSDGSSTRHVDLLWGIVVPTQSIDLFAAGNDVDHVYGATLAHEVAHVLGLAHRIAALDPFPDRLTVPRAVNLMFPSINPGIVENFDIIQAKAVRNSEVLRRNP